MSYCFNLVSRLYRSENLIPNLSGESAPATYDPPDADHSYNVKVMLLSAPPPEDLFEKTCHFADSGAYSRETLVHPTRVIQFLVGVRGKNETMAIGGPWYY